jgi:hypothetical protein
MYCRVEVDAIDDSSENGEPNCGIDSSIAQRTCFCGVSAMVVSVEEQIEQDATEHVIGLRGSEAIYHSRPARRH